MYCGNCGLYFRVSLCILSTTFQNVLLVSLPQASITHAQSRYICVLTSCFTADLTAIYSKESFDILELGPLSALLVGGQRAPVSRRPFLHTHFFTKLYSYSPMNLCPNNDRSAFNSHSLLLLHNAVHFHPIMQSLPLLPFEQEALKERSNISEIFDCRLA